MSPIRIDKVSIFKLPDGFNSVPLQDFRTRGPRIDGHPLPANAKRADRYDLLESRAATQDSTETFQLSARNRERTHASSLEIWQHMVDGTDSGEPETL
ncbi:hypothetical protein [Mesorhizobium loti]|uniref:hypothetical protein n=1 Tax=Rhizobium loti TaxID=381 RepID=UPI00192A031D|nr:hypothetical protein [Mesorhizobium loti]